MKESKESLEPKLPGKAKAKAKATSSNKKPVDCLVARKPATKSFGASDGQLGACSKDLLDNGPWILYNILILHQLIPISFDFCFVSGYLVVTLAFLQIWRSRSVHYHRS